MADNHKDLPTFCLNCDTSLQGQWCHNCGQKAKSQVRHFGSVFMDIMDTVFEYDNRIWRTLAPLYFLPGKITRDYIAGKRARYVLPFRLFFVLSVVSFLVLQLSSVPDRLTQLENNIDAGPFAALDTPDAVLVERDRQLAEIRTSIEGLQRSVSSSGADVAVAALEAASRTVTLAADRRLAELGATDESADTTEPEEPAPTAPVRGIILDGESAWDPRQTPVQITWLPAAGNRLLNSWLVRGLDNMERVSDNPRQLIEAMLNLLPVVLFFMLPVFALLLKVFYLFSGRLYMEHFVVALHSHSFLFLSGLLALLTSQAAVWSSNAAWLAEVFGNLYWLVVLWVPVYLLLMQRKVYQQGWLLTLMKYCIVGFVYFFLVMMALLAAALISLVSL